MQGYISSLPGCGPHIKRCFDHGKHFHAEPHAKTKGMIVACGKEVERVSIRDRFVDLGDIPIVLARVAVDTSCLDKPLVKIDFSTMIQVLVPTGINTFGALLDFQLVINCRGEREVLNNYQYVADIRENVSYNFRQSFSFTFCDDDIFCQRDCCVYSVELANIDFFVSNGNPLIDLLVEDSAIRAIAQGICNGSKHEVQKQPVCKNVALVCGKEKNTVDISPVISADLRADPIILAKLSLDVNCTHKPQVAINFSTLISVEEAEAVGFTDGVQLNFVLKRKCNGAEKILRGYEYIKSIDRAETSYNLKNVFVFTFCDDEFICTQGCCIYTVELVGIEILRSAQTINRLVIENSALNAVLCD